MHIVNVRLKNFKSFRNAEMLNIPRFCVIVGANGSGKTIFFSVFEFIRESLSSNVHAALIKLGGDCGFNEVRSRGVGGAIEIEIQFRISCISSLMTYYLLVENQDGKAVFAREFLKYNRENGGRNPVYIFDFSYGEGKAVVHDCEYRANSQTQYTLSSLDMSAVKALSQLECFPAVLALRTFIEGWSVSNCDVFESPSLLCIEHPEKNVYPTMLLRCAEELRARSEHSAQIFVSSHSPDFVNALKPQEVYWLVKKRGYTTIRHAQDNEQIVMFLQEGDQLGNLWRQGFFEGA